MKGFWGKLLCKLGWHDWEETPGEWKEDFPGCKSYTNAQCSRCPARTDLVWMSKEEARAVYDELQREISNSQWG